MKHKGQNNLALDGIAANVLF